MTIGLYPHIAAYRLSGHTAAASSVGWPVPSAWHGTALYSGRAGRHQRACGEGACGQAGDHRFWQHGSSAEPSIYLKMGPASPLSTGRDACFIVRDTNGQTLAYVYFEDEPRPGARRPSCSRATRPGTSPPASPSCRSLCRAVRRQKLPAAFPGPARGILRRECRGSARAFDPLGAPGGVGAASARVIS